MIRSIGASAVLAATLFVPFAHGQTRDACDPRVRPQPGPLGYKQRGDRCEGLYETLVSEGALRPVSLTYGDMQIRPGMQEFWWTASPGIQTNLRVASVAALYRMDAFVTRNRYSWPTDVFLGAKLQNDSIGITAVTQETVNARSMRVYLPVSLSPQDATVRGKYLLKIVSPEDLDDVSFEVSAVLPTGNHTAIPARSLGLAYYASATPLAISIDLSKEPAGLYEVVVAGRRKPTGAGKTSTSFLMRHGF